MGNNPSTPTGHQPPSSKPHRLLPAESATSPRTLRNPHRSPIAIGHTALAAPPEPSNAFAHGHSVPTRAGFSHLQQHHQQYYQQQQHTHSPTQGSSPVQPSQAAEAAGAAPKAGPVEIPEATKPVDVPQATAAPHTVAVGAVFDANHSREDPLAVDMSAAMLPSNSISDLSYLTRPPRLPLPIEEELKTPGSPIAGPTDVAEIIDEEGDILAGKPAPVVVVDDAAALEDPMSRKASGTTTDATDDGDLGDWGGVDGAAGTGQTVPTRIEWLSGGEKVWVTGTIFQWKRKHRLHPIEGKPGCFADTINVVSGTHHIRFLVDGVMTTSENMPTTVDLANNLVNYIVVSPEDAEKKAQEAGDSSRRDSTADSEDQEEAKRPKTRPVPPPQMYRHPIPQYLSDFDQPEDSPVYQRAIRAMEKLPPPPALPGFLAKPILNAPMLVREDNSVLILPPNHTVLNHLATCSIKNNILSVSATTRYKAKYVTTIIYKPSTMDE